MSTNHNRIKVSDLETSQHDKILKTNMKGELEFSDVSTLKTENYNALDCTSEGKALDARQGKVLKDMIDNKTVNLASDAETQTNTAVSEDSKVVSRSKLFNWWQWIKSQTHTISGAWNFTNKITLATSTKDTPSLIIPNGSLTTTPQNGAIERDENGQLWETHNGVRYKLLNTLDASLFVAKENLPTDIVNNDITTTIPTKSSLNLLYPDIPVGTYIHFTKIQSNPNFPVTYRKTTFGWIMFGFTQIIQ